MQLIEQCAMRGLHVHATKRRVFERATDIALMTATVNVIDFREQTEEESGTTQTASNHRLLHSSASTGTFSESSLKSQVSAGVSISSLRRTAVKVEIFKSHRMFLDTCITREGLDPRGFKLNWNYHFGSDPRVDSWLRETSQKLVSLCAGLAEAS